MKDFQEKNKQLQEHQEEDEEDEESMDQHEIDSQEAEQKVVRQLDDHKSKGKQVAQGDQVHRNDGDRVCEQCGRRFPNGRALGGHKKVHSNQSLPPKKTVNKFKPKNKKYLSFNLEGSSSNKISCSVCNKIFPSTKSLNGHMKLHRKRDWKGVRPPGPVQEPCDESNSSSSSENDYEEEDAEDEDDVGSSFSDHDIETDIDTANFLINLTKIEERRHRSLIADKTVPKNAENRSLANRQVPNAEDQVGKFSGKRPIEESPVGYKGKPSSKKIKMEESGFRSKYVEDQVSDSAAKKPIPESPVGYRGNSSLKANWKVGARSNKTMEGSKSCWGASFVPNKLVIGSRGKASMEEDDDENADRNSGKVKPKRMMMKTVSETGTRPVKDMALHDQTHKQIPRKTQEFGSKYAEKGKCRRTSARSRKLPDRAEEAEVVEQSIKQFACNSCPRKFSTSQGLGGHKRIHNRKKGSVRRAPAAAAPEVKASTDEEDGEASTGPDDGDHERSDLNLNQLPQGSDSE